MFWLVASSPLKERHCQDRRRADHADPGVL